MLNHYNNVHRCDVKQRRDEMSKCEAQKAEMHKSIVFICEVYMPPKRIANTIANTSLISHHNVDLPNDVINLTNPNYINI